MTPIRIKTRIESDTLVLPELRLLVGKTVEIRVTEAGESAVDRLLDSDYHADCEADTSPEVQLAERLIRRIGLAKNLRTLDALQLAVAINLNEPGEPIDFVCADHALCTLASAEGAFGREP